MKQQARPTRRAALICALAFGAMTLGSVPSAQAQTLLPAQIAQLRFRAIYIDASAIAARGLPNYARRVVAALTPRAREVFADRLAPGDSSAPSLVLRVDSLTVSGGAGFSRRRGRASGGFGDVNDYLEGEGLVVSPRGAVLARYPVLSSLGASYSGSPYMADNDDRRISNIGWHFASWVRRNMGL